MAIGIVSIEDVGGDVLLVKATDGAQTYEARGWVSATTNHYDAKAYGEDGQLGAKAKARAMTPDEVRSYALGLINAVHRVDAPAAEAKPIAFAAASDDEALTAELLAASATADEPTGAS